MVVWVLSISRRGAGPGILPRWGLLLAVLWVGGLLGCPGTGPQRARPPGEGPAAVALLRQQAGQGEREAQYQLGLLAFSGEGMPHDRHAAVQRLQRAAAQGHPEAQRLLGQLSLTGQGLPRNATAAAAWYRRAAEQGDPEAQWQLGRLIRQARGCPATRPRRPRGIVGRPRTGTPSANGTSDSNTCMAGGSPRIACRPTSGSRWPLRTCPRVLSGSRRSGRLARPPRR